MRLLILLLLILSESTLYSQYNWVLQSGRTIPRDIEVTNGGKVVYYGDYIMNYSSNLGLNWQKPLMYHYTTATEFYFLDSLKGYFQDVNKLIYKTSNGGLNWASISSVSFTIKGMHFINQITGWIIGENIMKTTNGGISWITQYIKTSSFDDESIFMLNNLKGFATSGLPDTFLVTTNGGSNWSKKSTGTGQYLRKVCFINNNVGYILSDPGAFLKTTDGGDSWQILPFSIAGNNLTFDFADENTGWLGNTYGIIAKTTNGGLNWVQKRPYTIGHPNASIYNIKCLGSNICFAAQQDGEFIKTTDGGDNWIQAQPIPYGKLVSITFINGQTGFVCNNSGEVWKTENRGKNWIANMTLSFNTRCMYSDSIIGCFIVGSAGNVLHTTNYGNSWRQISLEGDLNFISFTDQNTGWISGTGGKIYKTTNGGINWVLLQTNIANHLNSHYFINSNTGWFAGQNNALFKTTNSGLSFDSTMISGNIQEVYFTDALKGFVIRDYNTISYPYFCINKRFISKTTNGGLNWVDVKSESEDCHGWEFKYKSIKFTSPADGYAVSSTGDFLITSDSGNTWWNNGSPGRIPLNNLYFKNVNSGWVVGDNGIMLTMGDAIIGINNLYEITPERFELLQNYPNPFNSSTSIKFRINKPEHVKLSVFDISGKEIFVLMNSSMNPGVYDFNFDGTGLASGIYFYSLSAGEKTITKRMALIK